MRISLLVIGLAFLSGCAAITSTVNFSKQDSSYGESKFKVNGSAKVKFRKVQEFRSMLESLEYRETEKAK